MSGSDDFKIEDFRLPPGAVPPSPAPATARPKPRRRMECFTRVPCVWRDRLAGAGHIASYRVALHLLHEAWKTHDPTVPLSNLALAREGVSRRQKWRALVELERLGLIAIDRRPRRSPRITLLLTA